MPKNFQPPIHTKTEADISNPMASLEILPVEVLEALCAYLSPLDCRTLAQTHTRLRAVCAPAAFAQCTVIPNRYRSERHLFSYYNNFDGGRRPIPMNVFLRPARYAWFCSAAVRSIVFVQEAVEEFEFEWERTRLDPGYASLFANYAPDYSKPEYGFRVREDVPDDAPEMDGSVRGVATCFHPDVARYSRLRELRVNSFTKHRSHYVHVYVGPEAKCRRLINWEDFVFVFCNAQHNARLAAAGTAPIDTPPPVSLHMRLNFWAMCRTPALANKECLRTLEVYHEHPRQGREYSDEVYSHGAGIMRARRIAEAAGMSFEGAPSVRMLAQQLANSVPSEEMARPIRRVTVVERFGMAAFPCLERFSFYPEPTFVAEDYEAVFAGLASLASLRDVTFQVHDAGSVHLIQQMLPHGQYTRCCVIVSNLHDGGGAEENATTPPVEWHVVEQITDLRLELLFEGQSRLGRFLKSHQFPALRDLRVLNMIDALEALSVMNMAHLERAGAEWLHRFALRASPVGPGVPGYAPPPRVQLLDLQFVNPAALVYVPVTLRDFTYVTYLRLAFRIPGVRLGAEDSAQMRKVEDQARTFLRRARRKAAKGLDNGEVYDAMRLRLWRADRRRARAAARPADLRGVPPHEAEIELDMEGEMEPFTDDELLQEFDVCSVGSAETVAGSPPPSPRVTPRVLALLEQEAAWRAACAETEARRRRPNFRLSSTGLLALLDCPDSHYTALFDENVRRCRSRTDVPMLVLSDFCFWEVMFTAIAQMPSLEYLEIPGNGGDRALTSYAFDCMVRHPRSTVKQIVFGGSAPSWRLKEHMPAPPTPHTPRQQHCETCCAKLDLDDPYTSSALLDEAEYGGPLRSGGVSVVGDDVAYQAHIRPVERPQTSEMDHEGTLINSLKTYMIDVEGWRRGYAAQLSGVAALDYNYRPHETTAATLQTVDSPLASPVTEESVAARRFTLGDGFVGAMQHGPLNRFDEHLDEEIERDGAAAFRGWIW